MEIGVKIKQLRQQRGLTQEELAARTELTKGFISQLERDLTSPSIATLMDILEALGTDVASFFHETVEESVVYSADDMFVKEELDGYTIQWLVTNAQKNALEPILVTIPPGVSGVEDDPHEGEEFGYVLSGAVTLVVGTKKYRIKKGGSFYFRPTRVHYLINSGKAEARVLWVSTPPSF
ncbi:HTH-type transcriptional regulator PuuR [bioreactor metagenome]|uniref:HTH-type transcriptional regulator PuuR n=1 Tax=bioreactor metagenome TaxID=1076179 RepID=A0A644ZY30_9ZZZZ|nr:XRE family transcriptional regulator [Christensenella sp.]